MITAAARPSRSSQLRPLLGRAYGGFRKNLLRDRAFLCYELLVAPARTDTDQPRDMAGTLDVFSKASQTPSLATIRREPSGGRRT